MSLLEVNRGWLLSVILKVLAVLAILDTVGTLVLVTGGYTVELNPVMNSAIAESAFVFVASKFVLTAVGILLLWKSRKSPWALIVASLLVDAMLAVIILQAVMLYQILRG
jgi:hypothetical protein